MDQALRIFKLSRDISWHHNPRCHPSLSCMGITTWDVNPLWHYLAPRPKMSYSTTLLENYDRRCQPPVTLLGTTTQAPWCCSRAMTWDVKGLGSYDLRCQPLMTLFGTATHDVILHDVAREIRTKMLTLRDIAWHHNPRCHSSWHCSREMAWDVKLFVVLLGRNDMRCHV